MTVAEPAIHRAADRLWEADQTLVPCPPIRDLIEEQDVESAYAIQRINIDRQLALGRRISGWKIGITSRAAQQQLGVDMPNCGALFADTEYGHGSTIPFSRTMQPRVEAEIALVLGEDIDQEFPTISDVVRATSFVIASLEVVGCRLKDWDIRIADIVADNSAASLYVLGSTPRSLIGMDMASAAMTMRRNGKLAAASHGSDPLGHPLTSAAWLARTLAGFGAPLRAGDTILTGALGPIVEAHPGDKFEAAIEGLGTVTAVFSK
ncbi:2-keto-4-pentenoate hydratase [Arthrobacter sedimenti]|uniref:2-keto-4-pentenoate hydratase n=1 Tax=Arthrobacter sedimenti TaxID=2694931 RepID=UPI000B3530EF|nr:fumarylacetoacetate hydrolase family protein [Arthrobacter sedimenti]OUM44618.1 2-keto-4-pentenoate hydratase [Arthrobacter agilis]